jgi:hypothetical protein
MVSSKRERTFSSRGNTNNGVAVEMDARKDAGGKVLRQTLWTPLHVAILLWYVVSQ